jgi:hypothetical protein
LQQGEPVFALDLIALRRLRGERRDAAVRRIDDE